MLLLRCLLAAGLFQLGTQTCLAELDSDSLAKAASGSQPSFAEWGSACAKLPTNRSLRGRLPPNDLLPIPHVAKFDEVLTAFIAQAQTGSLAQAKRWLDQTPALPFLNSAAASVIRPGLNPQSRAISFNPFAQKVNLTEQSEIVFHADFHGDVHSLLSDLAWLSEHGYLREFSVSNTNTHLVFLGDYIDRGAYGVEVLYTLFRLKLANPENVFLLRGNHEDSGLLNQFSLQTHLGFLDEAQAKYGSSFQLAKVLRAFDLMPVVLYLGCNGSFLQCNHGGLEPGFDPRPLLENSNAVCAQSVGVLRQRQYLARHPEWFPRTDHLSSALAAGFLQDFQPTDLMAPYPTGFVWNDFSLIEQEPQFAKDARRAFIYGRRSTEFFLSQAGTQTARLQAVFRGHQQSSALNPIMRRLLASRGVFRHWQTNDSPALLDAPVSELAKVLERGESRSILPGSVWTFNVSPDSVYGENCGYSFDSFGILKLASKFADWRLQVVNIPVAVQH